MKSFYPQLINRINFVKRKLYSQQNSTETSEEHPLKIKLRRWKWQIENNSPPEIYNSTLYFCIFVFGVLGAARGIDEGGISGCLALKAFRSQFGLDDETKTQLQLANLESNIAAMVQLGSIAGAALASYSVDRLGRVHALRVLCIVWLIGAIIQITSVSVGQLYAGRFIEGIAIGQTTTVGPTYTAEVSPSAIRGLAVSIFAGSVYFGIMIAYFTAYGAAVHISATSNRQWMVVVALKLILSFLVLVMSFYVAESPRWLIKKDDHTSALISLAKLRGLPEDDLFVQGELTDILGQYRMEQDLVAQDTMWSRIKEIFVVKSNRYCFFAVAIMAQALGQWLGANAITIYASNLFALTGIRGSVHELKMLAILGVVKFVSAYGSAFFMIDYLGRRRSLYLGLTLQMTCLLYFAIFLTIKPEAVHTKSELKGADSRAAKGALAAIFLSGCGWTMGYNNIQYLMGSEIFPLNIRTLAQSIVMTFHFANQYGNSKALPLMMIAMKPYGAFYFFVGVIGLGFFWCWFFVPEVSGRSLELMQEMFDLPWYQIGRHGPRLCRDQSQVHVIAQSRRCSSVAPISKYHRERKAFVESSDKAE